MTARASFESRLRELLAEGTPGPWHCPTGDFARTCVLGPDDEVVAQFVACYTSGAIEMDDADAELICAAVTALPKLLECVDLLREAEYAGAWTTPQIDAWNAKRDTLLASLETET